MLPIFVANSNTFENGMNTDGYGMGRNMYRIDTNLEEFGMDLIMLYESEFIRKCSFPEYNMNIRMRTNMEYT